MDEDTQQPPTGTSDVLEHPREERVVEGDIESLAEQAPGQDLGPALTTVPDGARVRAVIVTTAVEPYESVVRAWPAHRHPDEVIVVAHQDRDDPPQRPGLVLHRMSHVPAERATTPWPQKLERYRAAVAQDTLLPEVLAGAGDVLVRDSLLEAFTEGLREGGVGVPEVTPLESFARDLGLRRLEEAVDEARASGASAHVLAGLTAELEQLRGA